MKSIEPKMEPPMIFLSQDNAEDASMPLNDTLRDGSRDGSGFGMSPPDLMPNGARSEDYNASLSRSAILSNFLSIEVPNTPYQSSIYLSPPPRENGRWCHPQDSIIPLSPTPSSPGSSGDWSSGSSSILSPSSPLTPSPSGGSLRSNYSEPTSPWSLTLGEQQQNVTLGAPAQCHDYFANRLHDMTTSLADASFLEYNGPNEGSLIEIPTEEVYAVPSIPGTSMFRPKVSSDASRQAANGRRKVPDNAKLFYCELCGDSFTRRKNLTNHTNSHQDYRPYVCCFCGQKFVTKHVMTRHQRAKHQPKSK